VYKLVPATARSVSFEGLNGDHSYNFGVRALTNLGDSSVTASHQLERTGLGQTFALPSLSWGKATTVGGKLTSNAGIGVAGEKLTLLARRADKSAFSPVATATTAADGSYVFAVAPNMNRWYEVAFPANSTVRMARMTTPQLLGVRSKVSEFLSTSSVRRGHTMLFSGSVRPHHYAGQRVYLKRFNHGEWQVLRKVRLLGTNSYTFHWTPRARRDFLYRVYKPARVTNLLGHRRSRMLHVS